MKECTSKEAVNQIHAYLESPLQMPFFVVTDTVQEQKEIREAFPSRNEIRVSSFCRGADSVPDLDRLMDALQSGGKENRFLLGLGEYANLVPDTNPFSSLKDLRMSGKLVVLCRFSRHLVADLCANDPKFNAQRVCFVSPALEEESVSVVQFPAAFPEKALKGFQGLLEALENGRKGELGVLSDLPLLNVQRKISSAFECLCWRDPSFSGQPEWLSEEQWEEFLLDSNLEHAETGSWRQFLGLKLGKSANSNSYLRYAAEKSSRAEDFPNQIRMALLTLSHQEQDFSKMYHERKKLLNAKTDGIAKYLESSKYMDKEARVFYLTDQTKEERQAIIELLEKTETIPAELSEIYPALHAWLAQYDFPEVAQEELRKLLVSYFTEYKRLKVTNQLTPEFLERVEELAKTCPFNQLPTRGSILEKYQKDSRRTFLLWVDALGAEYLSFLQYRTAEMKFRMKSHIVRAELPTITSQNSDFFKDSESAWPEEHRKKVERLDDLKHSGDKEKPRQAGYIEEELSILDDVLRLIREKFESQRYDRVLLVSDHGASRLAVLNEQENRWEMAEKGVHSGRCCPQNELDEKPEFASEGNGFWALVNYDLFRGGRKGQCEVHGGAALEEVVIPLIEFTPEQTEKVEVKLESQAVKAGPRTPARLRFFCARTLEKPSLCVRESFYPVQDRGENWFECELPDLKKSGKHTAKLYENGVLLCSFEFEIENEGMKKKDLFRF